MKLLRTKPSLFITIGVVIFVVVSVIMVASATYDYFDTRDKTIESMKRSAKTAIHAMQKTVANYIEAYAVNDYSRFIQYEMETLEPFAIVIEDFNTGAILGQRAFISGKIHDAEGMIVDYQPDSRDQKQTLETCCYSDYAKIVNANGEKIGTITIYISEAGLNQQLNSIITGTIVNTLLISIALILTLVLTLRSFVIKPVQNMIDVFSQTDEDGIPLAPINKQRAYELNVLAESVNKMIQTIRQSHQALSQQHQKLLSREDQLRTLSLATAQSPISVIICDPDNIIEYANPQFEKTSKYRVEDIVGHSIEVLFQGGVFNQNTVKDLIQALEKGQSWFGELTPTTRDDHVYCLRLSASVIFGEDGNVRHHVFVAEDVTEHKRNEEMLRTSQKMDAVGQLTGGIAHDFNNMLGIIMGNLELLEMSLQDQPKLLDRVRKALSSTQRGAQLTRKLLNFSRQETRSTDVVDVKQLVNNLTDLIQKSITSSIELETSFQAGLWNMNADAGELEDAILNLCLNARDAMPDGGKLIIEACNQTIDIEYIKLHPQAKIGNYVVIIVRDNGVGISQQALKKIFDPFYSTKPFGKGTGLGLSMVYGFVQRSGGFIDVDSVEGKGTTFSLYLPSTETTVSSGHKNVANEVPGGDETILIVDDEEALSQAAGQYLQKLGYHVLTANSAAMALDVLNEHEEVELVFSDIVMPHMNGYEMAVKILDRWPSKKILLSSGFASSQLSFRNHHNERIYQALMQDMLPKPYTMNELANAVRRVLDDNAVTAR